jgi:hypothetical protein
MGISIALRELLPKPSPTDGSRFKNYDRHEGAPLALRQRPVAQAFHEESDCKQTSSPVPMIE